MAEVVGCKQPTLLLTDHAGTPHATLAMDQDAAARGDEGAQHR